jgi:protein-S-isoprenylcysteine O-methyltransferase Ste14
MAEQIPYRLLTIAGFVLLFAVQTSRHNGSLRLWTLPAGADWAMAALCLVGFASAWWARIHLGQLWSAFVTRKADHRIIDTGPYGIVRHPIYTGIILAAFALPIDKGTVFSIAVAFLASLGFWTKPASRKASCAINSAPKLTTLIVAGFRCLCPLRLLEANQPSETKAASPAGRSVRETADTTTSKKTPTLQNVTGARLGAH